MNYFDSAGRPLRTGARLGAGGEGIVYDLAGSAPSRVIKIYHKLPGAAAVAKLQAMAGAADEAMLRVAAWPIDTVHTAPGGPLAGIVMPKVTGFGEIHLLYSPAHRRSEYPRADWGQLVHAARNLAAAVEAVHARGHVIGDVNQKNVTVAANATVMLVDCDGFQIARNGTIHPCEVGVAHFTPPELQGRSFRGIHRTANHDAFGLAVLCFHLLFMGRHPFAGRYSGAGDMPIERAIAEFRFSFGASARSYGMEPPPGALPLTAVTPSVATLFERAFGQTTAAARPNASQWRIALEEMGRQLRTCPRVHAHKFLQSLSACTWCELEGRTGVIFFLGIAAAPGAARMVFDLAAAWSAIEKIAPPRPMPPLPSPHVTGITARPIEETLIARRRRLAIARIAVPFAGTIAVALLASPAHGVLAGLVLVIALFCIPKPGAEEEVQRKAAFDAASAAWREVQLRWLREAQINSGAFGVDLDALRKQRDAYRELERQYARERGALETAKRARQLEQFLDRFFIDHAKIAKIGSGRKATLASYGIETAADVTIQRLAGVPGFGPTLVASLMIWRASIERTFTFDASKQIHPQEIARLDQKFIPQRRDLENALRAGPARLTASREQIDTRRTRLRGELDVRAAAWAQARADLDAMRVWRR